MICSSKTKETYRKINKCKKCSLTVSKIIPKGKVLQLEKHFQRNESYHIFKSEKDLHGISKYEVKKTISKFVKNQYNL